jgi:membrane protease YdiL (CAAX protease family)
MKRLFSKSPYFYYTMITWVFLSIALILQTVFVDTAAEPARALYGMRGAMSWLASALVVAFFARGSLEMRIRQGFSRKALLTGMALSAPILLLFLLACVASLSGGVSAPTPGQIQALACYSLFSAFFAETLGRAGVAESLCLTLGGGAKSVAKAGIASSAIYASSHLFGVLIGSGILETLADTAFAFSIAIVMASIYFRSGSLLAAILANTALTFLNSLWFVCMDPAALEMAQSVPQPMTPSDPMFRLVLSVFVGGYGYMLLSRAKNREPQSQEKGAQAQALETEAR